MCFTNVNLKKRMPYICNDINQREQKILKKYEDPISYKKDETTLGKRQTKHHNYGFKSQ